jgi:tetratricopeptide (TPR) repeat protein
MTEADLGTKPTKARRPIDFSLNIALLVLLLVVLGAAAYFGYTIYQDRQVEFNSSATGRLASILEQAVRKSPNDATIRVRYGEALGAMGKYQQAIEQFNAALKIDPKHSGAYLDLGMVAMLTKNESAAERYYQKVISLTEANQFSTLDKIREQAYFNLGLLTLEQKRYAEAAGFFKGALVIRRDASDTYYQLAKAYQALGDVDAAIQQLEIAIQFDPGFAEAHYYLGELYKLKKDDVNAAYHFKKAVDLAPDADQPKQALESYGTAADWIAKANTAAEAGNLSEAITDMQIARVLEPDNFDAAKLHAALLIKSGDIKGALDVSLAAGKLKPNDAAMQAQIKSLQKQVAAMKPAKKKAVKKKVVKKVAPSTTATTTKP